MKIKDLTKEQRDYILENYSNMQTYEIANFLNLDKKIISKFADIHKIKKNKNFIAVRETAKLNEKQKKYLLENYHNVQNSILAEKLECNVETILRYARNNKLKKDGILYYDVKNDKELTLEEKKIIIDNYSIFTNRDISDKFNIPLYKISAFAKRNNLKKTDNYKNYRKSSLTSEQKDFILNNYSTVETDEICKIINANKKDVINFSSSRKLLKNFGYTKNADNYMEECIKNVKDKNYNILNYINKKEENKLDKSNLYKSKYGKYFVNQNYFNKIDNEFKAYWLGFLYADGCVRNKRVNGKSEFSLSVALCREDEAHLKKFLDSIQSDSPISHNSSILKNYNKIYYSSKINICNKKIVEDLERLGCVQNKTLIIKFPSYDIVPKKLIRHFIRGFFDGDGSIHINLEKRTVRVGITGMENILNRINDIFYKDLKIDRKKIQRKDNIFQVSWGSIFDCHKIYEYLYNNCNIYLDRKLEKFNTLYCLGYVKI